MQNLKTLKSGVDNLNISLYINWEKVNCLRMLQEEKASAKQNNSKSMIELNNHDEKIFFELEGWGKRGVEWILNNKEYGLQIMKRRKVIKKSDTRPSVVVEIRSETIHALGYEKAVNRIVSILENNGAKVLSIKVSRLDLYTDVMVDEDEYNIDFYDYRVTRATTFRPIIKHMKLEGAYIGQGDIMVRIYDKAKEIENSSKKYWMYLIWNIKELPEGKKIIRIEFQLRREVIKQLGIDTYDQLKISVDNIWSYCTKKWLKFQSNPGEHRDNRKTLEWWKVIQKSTPNGNVANPSIRSKAYKGERLQIFRQAYGYFTTLQANMQSERGIEEYYGGGFKDAVQNILEVSKVYNYTNTKFNEDVNYKVMKYDRMKTEHMKATQLRLKNGMPTGTEEIKIENTSKNK